MRTRDWCAKEYVNWYRFAPGSGFCLTAYAAPWARTIARPLNGFEGQRIEACPMKTHEPRKGVDGVLHCGSEPLEARR